MSSLSGVACSGSNTCMAYGFEHDVLSTDGGQTWTPATLPDNMRSLMLPALQTPCASESGKTLGLSDSGCVLDYRWGSAVERSICSGCCVRYSTLRHRLSDFGRLCGGGLHARWRRSRLRRKDQRRRSYVDEPRRSSRSFRSSRRGMCFCCRLHRSRSRFEWCIDHCHI